MKGVTKALGAMNKQMNLPQIQKIMADFEKQSEITDMKQEIMEEAIEDMTGSAEDDEETELLTNKVLEELGISIENEVGSLPASGLSVKNETGRIGISDLELRLEKIKKS
uniref:Charged multivesicular body protein 2a (Trinotate prediction) n=1 Tax=Myxobolus squamalis TaxID=59785 RepID=A0A6B2G580_MYXSQ